jgi:hypothetical protein
MNVAKKAKLRTDIDFDTVPRIKLLESSINNWPVPWVDQVRAELLTEGFEATPQQIEDGLLSRAW